MTDRLDASLLAYLKPEERGRLEALLETRRKVWMPHPSNKPQQEAYDSQADILGYGGAAGGGKSDLGIGLALTRHRRVAIFRQTGTEVTAIVDRIADIVGGRQGFNGSDRIWRIKPKHGRPVQIELGSFPNPGDEAKYQGRPHDLLVFDEAANMREIAVRFLLGWLRSEDPDQRKRAVLTFNPPTRVEGRWVIGFFGPWLDKKHPRPAKPGELRWFATIDGHDRELESGRPFRHKGEIVRPMSRTFIPSRVSDNPYLVNTGYMAVLQSMPEPLRSQMLYGDFQAGVEDDPWQVIPTTWVEAAMARWEDLKVKPPMHAIGMDVAMGGRDNTILARRHGLWFDRLITYPGRECTDGATVAGYALAAVRNRAVIHIDLFGVGARPYGHLMQLGVQVVGVSVGDPSAATDGSGRLRFRNVRSQLWWQMREALDPAANNGIALPPDKRLLADLCAPTWKPVGPIIQVEGREELVKKIGRSPDFGSAVVLALMDTPKIDEVRRFMEHAQGTGERDYDPVRRFKREEELRRQERRGPVRRR